jgi:putative membrane protein insertion efficiency factor
MLRRVIQLFMKLPSLGLIGLVRLYQYTLSPLVGRQCRFHPTCSNYMIGAVEKYGVLRGFFCGLCRIARCHPWHPGGVDLP